MLSPRWQLFCSYQADYGINMLTRLECLFVTLMLQRSVRERKGSQKEDDEFESRNHFNNTSSLPSLFVRKLIGISSPYFHSSARHKPTLSLSINFLHIFGQGTAPTSLLLILFLFFLLLLLGRPLQKHPSLRRFKSDRDQIWQGCTWGQLSLPSLRGR